MKMADVKYGLVYGALKCVALLPLCVLYRFSDFAAWILRCVVKYRRELVCRNLTRCFPDASPLQIKRWEKQFYKSLCDTFIEALKLLSISDRQMNRRVEVVNASLVDDAVESGHSVVLFLGHYGNWEWVTKICAHFKSDCRVSQIYHPLSSAIFDRLMLKIRSRFGSESIPMSRTLRRLLAIEREGHHWVCGFISDQRPVGKELHNWADFMGIDTPFIGGGEELGEKMDAKFLYVDVERLSRGYYRLTFMPVEPDAEDLAGGVDHPYTRQYLRLLETTIRRNPPYWLWSHDRFRRTR